MRPWRRIAFHQRQRQRVGQRCRACRKVGRGDEDSGTAVLENVTQTVVRIGGIKRDIRPARFQHGQHGNDHRQPPRQRNGHTLVRSYPLRHQPVCQPVGLIVQLGIGQRGASVHHGHSIRCLRNLSLNQGMNACLAGIVMCRGIEALNHLITQVIGQHWQRTHRGSGLMHHAAQQLRPRR